MNPLICNTITYQNYIQQQNQRQSDVISAIKELGFAGVEFRRELFSNFDDEADLCQSHAYGAGLEIYYSVPDDFLSDGHLNPNLQIYFDEAKALGAEQIKFTVGSYDGFTAEMADTLAKLQETYQLKIVLENDQSTTHGTGEFMVGVLNDAEELGMNLNMVFDTGNFYYAGTSPFEAAGLVKDFVKYVHLKNVTVNGLITEPNLQTGDIHFDELLIHFSKETPLAVECMYEGDFDSINQQMADDLAWLKKTLA